MVRICLIKAWSHCGPGTQHNLYRQTKQAAYQVKFITVSAKFWKIC